jgi:hypothetical protein
MVIMHDQICENCKHFRPAIRPSGHLIQIVNTSDGTMDARIAESLNRIEDEQNRVEDSEIGVLKLRHKQPSMEWGFRPLMHGYCGLKERNNRYLIAEQVRDSELCRFEPMTTPAPHPCTSCIHCSTPAGPITDAANLAMITAGNAASGLGGAHDLMSKGGGGSGPQILEQYFSGIRSRQASEMGRAYQEKANMRIEPQYLPYCKKHSSTSKFVPCFWQNPHDMCSDWQLGGKGQWQPTPQVGPANVPKQTETLVFAGNSDYKRSGAYGFTLLTQTLVVSEPAGPQHRAGGPQNHYNLRNLAPNQWTRLKNARGELLDIYIHWDNVLFRARVGSPPPGKVVVLPVMNYSREWQFDIQPKGLYTHPEGGFSLIYTQDMPWTSWYISVHASLGKTIFIVDSLPTKKWTQLRHSSGAQLPLKVYRDRQNIQAQWLPLDSLGEPDKSIHSDDGGGKSSTLGQALGAALLLGIGIWIASNENTTDDKS